MNILNLFKKVNTAKSRCDVSLDEVTIVGNNSEFESMAKKSTKTQRGLYPSEVVMIYFCKTTNKYPSLTSPKNYPLYWKRNYGIGDVDAILESLGSRGFIEKDDSGHYKPTKMGLDEIERNEFIIWAHKTGLFGGAWEIERQMRRAPVRMSNWSWRDKVRWLFQDEQLLLTEKIASLGKKSLITGEAGEYRNSVLSQAQFLEYERRYKMDAGMYERVLEIDKKIDGENYRPVPGIIESINKCKRKAAANERAK